jgi:hypothetical protein
MSHYAEIDENNVVLRVVVGNPDLDDNEGLKEITKLLGGTWIQTSYNASIRGKYAGSGDIYLKDEDIFIEPQPFPSWTRKGSHWYPPTDKPLDGKIYQWNEENKSWQLATSL